MTGLVDTAFGEGRRGAGAAGGQAGVARAEAAGGWARTRPSPRLDPGGRGAGGRGRPQWAVPA